MNEAKVTEIYKREREYQRLCFGEYADLNSLNFASFLQFIEEYLQKAKKSYSGKWDTEMPGWLISCKEMEEGSAPVEAYEEIIKVMALCGAALETYTALNPSAWRKNPEDDGQKWRE